MFRRHDDPVTSSGTGGCPEPSGSLGELGQGQPAAHDALPQALDRLVAVGDDAPDLDHKLDLARTLRARSPQSADLLDRFLLTRLAELRGGLNDATGALSELRALLEEHTAPPWRPGVFLGLADTPRGAAALVAMGAEQRVVGLDEELDPVALDAGDEVLLTQAGNRILGRSPYRHVDSGDTAAYVRRADDRRLVLRFRDEEVVVDAGRLAREDLRPGDPVRWHRGLWLALEKLERSDDGGVFLEETPSETFADVGGLDSQVRELQRTVLLHLRHAGVVRKYGLQRKGSVLLSGPPGTGKTLLARALASWLAQVSGAQRSRFINVRPASLNSMWYGQSEANYREVFRIAREAGEREPDVPVVIFFDEIDSVGHARGGLRGSVGHTVDDRVQTAFMAELDGLEARGNVLVVAATNRRDALDPALVRPGRLGDLVLEVPRPGRAAARGIFRVHLPEAVPWAATGSRLEGRRSDAAIRDELIDAAVARIFAAGTEAEIATLTFRDGRRRVLRAADLVSGATIASIARAALERATWREVEEGSEGVTWEDLLTAIEDEFETRAQGLTPANAHRHLDDLPQDVDVVRVETVQRRVARPYRYLNAVNAPAPEARGSRSERS